MFRDCKAVIFDWAYTLVNLVDEDDRRSLRRVYDRLVDEDHPLPEFDRFYQGFRTVFHGRIAASRESLVEARFDCALSDFLQQNGVAASGDPELSDLVRLYYEPMYARRRVYDDALPTLEALRLGGFRLAVVSNTTNPGYMKDLERRQAGLDHYFEVCIYSSEVSFRKPHPSIFQQALSELGLPGHQAVFVGDHPEQDIRGAREAGLRTVWINRGGRVFPGGTLPDCEIARLTELPALLGVG